MLSIKGTIIKDFNKPRNYFQFISDFKKCLPKTNNPFYKNA